MARPSPLSPISRHGVLEAALFLLQAIRTSSYESAACDAVGASPANAVSLLHMQKTLGTLSVGSARQPFGKADTSLQAQAEGNPFAAFFNQRLEGRGIHKWLQYFPAYQRHLGKFIGREEVHIVEIGIQSGGSLDMWKSVFGPGARVYGCDLNPNCTAFEENNTEIFIGDQGDPNFWEYLKRHVPRIDILIDDGSHMTEHQIATLGIMLSHVSPDGVYITEDVHGNDNPFWQLLKLSDLRSPSGNKYGGLGNLVSSVHVYPYLLVLERSDDAGEDAMLRQLGARASEQPAEVRVAVSGASDQPVGPGMNASLGRVFPWLRWEGEEDVGKNGVWFPKKNGLPAVLAGMHPDGWLFVRDGGAEFSIGAPWDAQADAFMLNILAEFNLMHEGNCCDWSANTMQQSIESLHVYPHLLIVKRTDGQERVVKAPQHGTSWIPS